MGRFVRCPSFSQLTPTRVNSPPPYLGFFSFVPPIVCPKPEPFCHGPSTWTTFVLLSFLFPTAPSVLTRRLYFLRRPSLSSARIFSRYPYPSGSFLFPSLRNTLSNSRAPPPLVELPSFDPDKPATAVLYPPGPKRRLPSLSTMLRNRKFRLVLSMFSLFSDP